MKPNHSSETVQHAVWFDTETKERKVDDATVTHHLEFGWAAYRRRLRGQHWSNPTWFRFTDRIAFARWLGSLCRPRTRLFTFCHNTSFDLPVLDVFRTLPAEGWKLLSAVIDAPPTILKWRRESASIVMLDTLNIWRMPLAGIGEQIGLPKLPFPGPDATPEQWDTYGKRDVEIIMAACLGWFDMLVDNDMGGFAHTLAAQSLRTYRHKYMKHRILIDNDPRALELAREAYHGGRVECSYIGTLHRDLYYVDVNSMYPHVMREEEYPTILKTFVRRASVLDLKKWILRFACVARVMIETDVPAYAVRYDDKLIFPVGRFECALTTPDLRYALAHGHVKSVKCVALYEKQCIFREFVDDLYAQRLKARREGNHVLAWQLKILQNSLYGKWGQRGIVYEALEQTHDLSARKWVEYDVETGTRTNWRQLGGLVQHQVKENESLESMPAIAAHICAYARQRLWAIETIAGRENVYYKDTDGLLVNQTGFYNLDPLLDSETLGLLKLEGVFTYAEIQGPKDYRFGHKSALKGVRQKACWLSGSTVQQEKWSSLRGLLATGNLDAPSTAQVTKSLSRCYSKGVVGPGGHVQPLRLIHGLGSGGNRLVK